jgi:hypothetical protein
MRRAPLRALAPMGVEWLPKKPLSAAGLPLAELTGRFSEATEADS